jgi:hypothetical protein
MKVYASQQKGISLLEYNCIKSMSSLFANKIFVQYFPTKRSWNMCNYHHNLNSHATIIAIDTIVIIGPRLDRDHSAIAITC